jgi:hypothetical protein
LAAASFAEYVEETAIGARVGPTTLLEPVQHGVVATIHEFADRLYRQRVV